MLSMIGKVGASREKSPAGVSKFCVVWRAWNKTKDVLCGPGGGRRLDS